MSYEEVATGLGYTCPPPTVDLLVQQCLEYHETQETLRQKHEPQPFVSASQVDSLATEPIVDETLLPNQLVREKCVQEGMARAQAILAKFEKQQQELLPIIMDSGHSSVYVEQRRKGFLREERRKQLALLKNLEYISHREQSRMEALSAQVSQQSEYLHRIDQRLRQNLDQRRAAISKDEPRTVAVYVSGIKECEDGLLRQLFESYGTIHKIHRYRDKQTKQLKGDGLVIYAANNTKEGNDTFIETICAQLNGAELPSGQVLCVEPASTNQPTTQFSAPNPDKPTLPASKAAMVELEASKPPSNGAVTVQDDLEDFFDSLS